MSGDFDTMCYQMSVNKSELGGAASCVVVRGGKLPALYAWVGYVGGWVGTLNVVINCDHHQAIMSGLSSALVFCFLKRCKCCRILFYIFRHD